MSAPAVPPELREFALTGLTFWTRPEPFRMRAFAKMRALDAAPFVPLVKIPFTRSAPGFYVISRHADVLTASRNAELFSSEPASNTLMEMPPWAARFYGSMINMDDPEHARIRRVVSRAFSPRMLERLDDDLRRRAARIVDDVVAEGPRDFVAQVAARLPVEIICDIMGIPDTHQDMILRHTNTILGYTDPEYNGMKSDDLDKPPGVADTLRGAVRIVRAGNDLFRLVRRLGKERRGSGGEDLVTRLVTPNAEGEALTSQEIGSFFVLLVAAGNETTRNAIAHTLRLLTEFPDQRALLLEDFEGRIAGTIDEVLRYSPPVIQFRRNVTRDTELHGVRLKKGDIVVMVYPSANRDETVFTDPDVFDITRSPNPHVAFGAPGPHYCMGTHLARREMTVLLRELLTRLPDVRMDGEPDFLASYFINGIKRMPFTFTPPGEGR
ncbi:cytochrome P450 [Actinocorallia sp. A-T 12471]|uniref:cytochrome P450 n=1 Tax=Actinocorallia sp. A-T 12471 TaxID=3089813 RepID=UPI0029CBCACD|nr:cytochrome P450 [Actinocorallia sp. A-T 12471]MDX6742205.1 cytochrome P450 [Actinocorallia sp. A-T 12471]